MERPSAALEPARQQRGEDTKRLLLEAALQCFAEYGVADTNTTMISERAGLSRGAYLHHFKSREMLIAAAIDFTQQQVLSEIEENIRQLFLQPTDELFLRIWQRALPDTFMAGYEMMMLARHNDTLQQEWLHHSEQLRRRRLDILTRFFGARIAKQEALPLVEGIADFYRGLKTMELVRSDSETRKVITTMAPIFTARLIALQPHLRD